MALKQGIIGWQEQLNDKNINTKYTNAMGKPLPRRKVANPRF